MKPSLRTTSRAFTIPEMLVAFTIFSVVMSVTSVVFINVSRSYRVATGFFNAQQNMRYAMELMTREVKEGTQYGAPSPDRFEYTSKSGTQVAYFLQNSQLMRQESGNAYPLTDTRMNVSGFAVVVARGSGTQPRVTFLIRIVPKGDQSGMGDLAFTLQTTITQRKITF